MVGKQRNKGYLCALLTVLQSEKLTILGVYSSMVHLFPFRTEKLSLLALMVLPF